MKKESLTEKEKEERLKESKEWLKKELEEDRKWWAQQPPEQRASHERVNEMLRFSREKEEKEQKELESKLTKKEVEIRRMLKQVLLECSMNRHIHGTTMEDAEKTIDKKEEEVSKMIDLIIEKYGDSPELFRNVLRSDEKPMFERAYIGYKKSRSPFICDITVIPSFHKKI